MNKRTTILFVCFLVALAQGQSVINWAGNWDQKAAPSDTACYPASNVLISQTVGNVTASWIWANSKPCIQAGLAGKQFNQTVPTPAENSIDLKITVGTAVVNGTFTITGDDAFFASNNEASAAYSRRQQLVSWVGTWDIVTQNDTACNPDGSIAITTSGSYVSAKWTWANSEPCKQAGIAGQVLETSWLTPTANAVTINIQLEKATATGIFAVTRDQAIFANIYGASATFVRKQQLMNWAGTWDISSSASSTACYPDGYITIIPFGGNLTASWVWANSKPCTEYGLAGKPFTQTQPVPRGSAIFLDFIVGGAYVSGLFSVSSDYSSVTSTFSSYNGASATFSRRDQMVNWAGVWDVATQDKTVCSPDSIIVAQNPDNITISWTWANTPACSILALAGKKVSQAYNLRSTNYIAMDISSSNTSIAGIWSVYLDGAIFSSSRGASSTYTRKQENVAFAGTWNISNQTSVNACYPNSSVIITQAGGNVTAKWTWSNSVYCTNAGLAGKNFTQTEPVPRGKSIFLDFVVGTDTRVSGLFTVNGNKATFASNKGASAGFDRQVVPTTPGGGSGFGTLVVILIIVVIAVAGYKYNRNKKLEGTNFESSVSYNRA